MSQADPLSTRFRPLVADLQAALDADDDAAFRGAFERLRETMGAELMPELKRITESAQCALVRFRDRVRLDTLAEQEVPDARKRLAHVVKLTDEAAHRTLDLVEQSGPIIEATGREAAQLLEAWTAYGNRQLAVASLWPERTLNYLERTIVEGNRVRDQLTQMLMAQGYQDITGQIIRGVTSLVGELEDVLGQLVALTNGEDTRRMPALRVPPEQKDWRGGVGPQVPGTEASDAMSGQDDIDALLNSIAGGG
jgi:chemotaxis protein CheZ